MMCSPTTRMALPLLLVGRVYCLYTLRHVRIVRTHLCCQVRTVRGWKLGFFFGKRNRTSAQLDSLPSRVTNKRKINNMAPTTCCKAADRRQYPAKVCIPWADTLIILFISASSSLVFLLLIQLIFSNELSLWFVHLVHAVTWSIPINFFSLFLLLLMFLLATVICFKNCCWKVEEDVIVSGKTIWISSNYTCYPNGKGNKIEWYEIASLTLEAIDGREKTKVGGQLPSSFE